MTRGCLTAGVLFLVVLFQVPNAAANHASIDIPRVRKYGPQINNILQVQTSFGTTAPMWDALSAGTIDFGEWPIHKDQVGWWLNQYIQADIDGDGQPDCRDTVTGQLTHSKYRPGTDPIQGAICLVTVNQFDMVQFDINNYKPPGNNVHFRRAIAHLTDMANFLTNICQGLCTSLDGIPIPHPTMADWRSVVAVNAFPKYDPPKAWNSLQAGGITDADADGILEMDLNADGIVGATEEPVVTMYVRLDINRNGIGRDLANKLDHTNPVGDADNLRARFGAGFRVTFLPFYPERYGNAVFATACRDKNYTIYTGGWRTGISPDLLYLLYHPLFSGPGLTNYNCINIPELTSALEALFFAPDALTALNAAFKVQGLWAEHVPTVPLWSNAGKMAYRAVARDAVNFVGSGEDTLFSFLTTNFGPFPRPWNLRWNAINPPESLNVIYNSDPWGSFPLGLVYDSLIALNPNKPTILGNEGIMNWMAKKWTLGTYTGPTANAAFTCTTVCDVLTFELDPKHPILFQDGTQMTADDVAFSFTYLRDSVPYGGFVGGQVFDVVDTALSNRVRGKFYTASVYYDSRSFYHLIKAGTIPIISKAMWQSVPFASPPDILETAPASPSQGAVTGQIGTGPFKLVNWDKGTGTVLLERHNDYFKSSRVYDSFHGSGNVNGLSPDMVAHLQSVHGYPISFNILTDNSNKIDVLDLVLVGGNFNRPASVQPKADLNEDGIINILDLVRVGGNMFKDWDHGDWTTFPAPPGHPITYP